MERWVKTAKPIDISVTFDGKSLNGEFLGVEVMNVPFTGPALPLAAKANIADGRLDIVCFDADRRRELKEWLASPLDETPPVTTRQGKIVELTWTDTANRLDDESHSNRDTKQIAEVACEKDQVQVLVPVKHPAQQSNDE